MKTNCFEFCLLYDFLPMYIVKSLSIISAYCIFESLFDFVILALKNTVL
jgi:hypothetical protein